MITKNIRFRVAYDLAADWTSENPVLLAGEYGIESDTKKRKLGDGATAWNDLPYDGVTLGAALTAIDALTPVADTFPYFKAGGDADLAALTPFARNLLDDTNAASARDTLGVVKPTPVVPPLSSGWVDFGGGFAGAQYQTSFDGWVTVTGLVKSGTDGTILTLPVGSRPAETLIFQTFTAAGTCRVDVLADGRILLANSSAAYTSLAGISFFAA